MSPLARMFGAMISGFATGVAIAAVIVFALMMWMSRPKAPERATVEPPSAPAQEPAPSWKPSEPAEPRAIRQQYEDAMRNIAATLALLLAMT